MPATARQISTPRKVLPFHAPEAHILKAVEVDCHALRIPTYDEIRGVYSEALTSFLKSRDLSSAQQHFITSRNRLASTLRVSPAVVEPFTAAGERRERDPELIAGMEARERQYEAAAYLLGLYVARREFARLGGGVL